jgi:hypothetical protein
MCRRCSSDGSSCVCDDDRRQVSSSTCGLSCWLVSGMTYDLELGDCALLLPPRRKTSREETLGFDYGLWRYGHGGAV